MLKREEILAIVLAASPLINVYGYVPFGFGTILYGILAFLILLKKKYFITGITELPLFLLYLIIWRFSIAILEGNLSQMLSPNLILFVFGYISLTFLDFRIFLKSYKCIILIIFTAFLAQLFGNYFLNIRLHFLASGLPLNTGLSKAEYVLLVLNESDRFSSFFLEPAHQSVYCLPLFAYLINKQNKCLNDYLFMIIILFILLFSRSGVGFIGLILIVFSFLKANLSSRTFVYLVFSTLFFVILFYFFIYDVIVSRSVEILNPVETDSAYIRILRGFLIFNDFNYGDMLFGLGIPENLKVLSSTLPWFLNDEDLYLSGLHYILIYSGLIGGLLFIGHVLKIFKQSHFQALFILLMLITPFFPSQEMLFFYTINKKVKYAK